MTSYNPDGTYAELLEAVAHGHDVTPQHLAQAQKRDQAVADADALAAQVEADMADAMQQRDDNRAAHDAEHRPVLEAMLAELDARRTAREEATAPFREARAALTAAQTAEANQYRAIRDYVAEQYGPAEYADGAEKPVFDTYTSNFGGPVVAGEPVPHPGT